jgi:hypothetical protein
MITIGSGSAGGVSGAACVLNVGAAQTARQTQNKAAIRIVLCRIVILLSDCSLRSTDIHNTDYIYINTTAIIQLIYYRINFTLQLTT